MRVLYLLVFLLLWSSHSMACLNGETKYLNNTMVYEDDEDGVPEGHEFMLADSSSILHSLDSAYGATDSVAYLNDMGYMYIIMGHYQEAINLFQEIEKKSPGLYATAANMGTAYELLGDNENALHWIERAVEISPSSHQGSEWIHVNILKTKICGDSCISSQNIIGTDFGSADTPRSSLSQQRLDSLYRQLYYQLNERLSFIHPLDRIVAQMQFDMGNIAYLLGDRTSSIELYQDAEEYGFQDSTFLSKRQSTANLLPIELEDASAPDSNRLMTTGSVLIILLGVFLLILALMSRSDKRRATNKNEKK